MNNNKEAAKILFANLQEKERGRTCGREAAQLYQKIHNFRFHKTFEICKRLVPNSNAHVLDVGPSYLTKLLTEFYSNVCTLGLDTNIDDGGQRETSTIALGLPHITFDLRLTPYPDRWPDIHQSFDLIVYAETIEHLPIAPEYSLVFLSNFLSENGILLVTTPNAAMIMKRFILLLKGKNPYEQIRSFGENPGHYREYTMDELITLGTRCKLEVVHTEFINFYPYGNIFYRLLKSSKPTMRDSLVIAFRKQTT
jgi:hypothetical protein